MNPFGHTHWKVPGRFTHRKAQLFCGPLHSSISWHVLSAPGSKPGLHRHSNPPILFLQVPLPQMPALSTHSFLSSQVLWSAPSVYPLRHSQRYDPSMFIHIPFTHRFGFTAHSFTSTIPPEGSTTLPYPSGHRVLNSASCWVGQTAHCC